MTSSGLFYTSEGDGKFVFAVGGNRAKTVERYNVDADAWEVVPSFREATEADITGANNFLFTYTMCSTSF